MRLLLHGGPRSGAVAELARRAEGALWLAPTGEAAGRARAAARAAKVKPAFVGTFSEWAFRLLGADQIGDDARRKVLDAAFAPALRDATERLRLATRAILATEYPGGREGADILLEAILYQKGDEWRDGPDFPVLFPEVVPARGALDVLARAYDGEKHPRMDEADVVLALRRRLRDDLALRAELSEKAFVVSDLEETTPLERSLLAAIAPRRLLLQGHEAVQTGRRGPPPTELYRVVPDLEVREFPAPPLAPVRTAAFPTPEAEARYVAAGVGGLVAARTRPGTIAVIHPHPSPPAALVDALSKARAPLTRLAGQGDPLGETAEALWAYLRWVADPEFLYKRTNLQHQPILAALLCCFEGVTREAALRFVRALGSEGPGKEAAEAIAGALRRVGDARVGHAVERLLAHRKEVRTRLASLTPVMAVREARGFLATPGVVPPSEPAWDHALVTAVEGEAKGYEKVSQLAEDLRRWREGEAVAVVPASRAKMLDVDHVFIANCTAGIFPEVAEGPVFERDERRFAAACSAARKGITLAAGGAPSAFMLRHSR